MGVEENESIRAVFDQGPEALLAFAQRALHALQLGNLLDHPRHSYDLPGRGLHRIVTGQQIARSALRRFLSPELPVENRPPGLDDAQQERRDERRGFRNDFPHRPAQMIVGGQAVHRRQPIR